MLTIAGYDQGSLVDGSGLLADPSFWVVHLAACLQGAEVDGADADQVAVVAMDPERWPVFTVQLRAGHEIHVVYRNLDGDSGVDYLMHHPEWDEAETLAIDDGNFMGPGLSWLELAAAARYPARAGVTDPDVRLLLLFPMLGDAGIPGDAETMLAAAVSTAHAVFPQPAQIARHLLANQGQWLPARWTVSSGTRVCDGSHSYRNPRNNFALPSARLAAVSAALDPEFDHD